MNALERHRTFLDFFPVPDFLLLATSGISISDNSVRFIDLGRGSGGNKFELLHAESIPLEPGIVESGFINNQEALVNVLKKLSDQYGVRYARVSLPEEKSYLFTANLSDVDPDNLRDAVAFIIEENAPVTLANAVFDFEVVEKVGNGAGYKVVVTVLPKKVVEAYTDAFEAAGITPVAFDIESQAVAKSVVSPHDPRTQLVINLGRKKTGLYVVEGGHVQFSLTPNIGVSRADSPSGINDLRSEVRKLFAFWNTRLDKDGQPASKIERVLVVGESASDKELVSSLMSGIEVEYAWADVWSKVMSLGKSIPKIPFEESLSYAAAVGLALTQRNSHV